MRIVVHTMGKVGSVSLVNTLKNNGWTAEHLHYGFLKDGEFTTGSQLAIGKNIRTHLENWNIITIIRRPLLRNLSAFFHSLGKYYKNDYYNPESLKNLFVHKYPHDWPDRWFRDEFLEMYKFNPIMHFDPEQPYMVFREGKLNLLVLKLEYMDKLDTALKDFGLRVIGQVHYVHDNKNNTPWYNAFKRQLSLKESFIEQLNNLSYAKHMYSEADLSTDIARYAEEEDYKACYPW